MNTPQCHSKWKTSQCNMIKFLSSIFVSRSAVFVTKSLLLADTLQFGVKHKYNFS